MLYDYIKNNYAEITGRIETPFLFSHENFGENFYRTKVRVSRLSSTSDVIPLLFSDRIIDVRQSCVGKLIRVSGQFRSFNRHKDDKSHLILHLFVRAYAFAKEEDEQINEIYLDGFLCKEPVYRITPKGRQVCDILLAVNRAYNRSDYIPCICWGRNAAYAAEIPTGGRVRLWGRIQSRSYQKQCEGDKVIRKETYEVSVSQMEYMSQREAYISNVADSAGPAGMGVSYYEDDIYSIKRK